VKHESVANIGPTRNYSWGGIVQDAWDAVPDEYIQGLYDSWWRRCEAVKEAHGGPTKY
jgi:hypothetical protein